MANLRFHTYRKNAFTTAKSVTIPSTAITSNRSRTRKRSSTAPCSSSLRGHPTSSIHGCDLRLCCDRQSASYFNDLSELVKRHSTVLKRPYRDPNVPIKFNVSGTFYESRVGLVRASPYSTIPVHDSFVKFSICIGSAIVVLPVSTNAIG